MNETLSHAQVLEHAERLMAQRQFDAARDAYLWLANDLPHGALFWFHVGRCSEILGEYVAAKAAFRQAIEAHNVHPQPDKARAYFGYGSCLYRLGEDGESWWREGLDLPCDTAGAITERGNIRLTLGEYAEGWADTESRRQLGPYAASLRGHGVDPKTLEPEWDGEAEGSVRVYADQGAGDAVLFSRWLSPSRAHYLQVGEPLRRLLDGYAYPPRCAFSAPLSSLPLLLRAPGPIPPYQPFPWARPKNPKPKIGVCWKGSTAYLNDRDRSCPYDPRNELTNPKWDVYSLQQGVDFESPDYAWNADYLRQLNVVITVDSSTAHLAATLGVPTILIAQSQPFWCWGTKGDATPWYPSVKIVRRKTVHDWEAAWEQAKTLIREML